MTSVKFSWFIKMLKVSEQNLLELAKILIRKTNSYNLVCFCYKYYCDVFHS